MLAIVNPVVWLLFVVMGVCGLILWSAILRGAAADRAALRLENDRRLHRAHFLLGDGTQYEVTTDTDGVVRRVHALSGPGDGLMIVFGPLGSTAEEYEV